jgi:hypothetical protein
VLVGDIPVDDPGIAPGCVVGDRHDDRIARPPVPSVPLLSWVWLLLGLSTRCGRPTAVWWTCAKLNPAQAATVVLPIRDGGVVVMDHKPGRR